MKNSDKMRLVGRGICVFALGITWARISIAQEGYQIGENNATANAGPVRLARVSYLSGPVTWRPDDSTGWSTASMNLPFRQGAEVWVKTGSRAELQFDDGSTMRLGGGAVVTLQDMYSDDKREFTELKLTGGLATLHLRGEHSQYQIDTPLTSVKTSGPVLVRVGVGNTVEVACEAGNAEVEGRQGNTVLHSKERLTVADPNAPYHVTSIPAPDQWDHFNGNRDRIYSHHNLHVPRDIDLVAGNLDDYGTWHDDPHYGYVWAPRVREAGWRPYHHGHWVWVSPWGWTWVGNEDWGWAPYHYGTWVDEPYGWAWCPGPAVQYWSPAVVDFADDDGVIAWAPLAPAEVVYPPLIDIGFRSGNWWFNFSIGGSALFFPAGPSFCEARPWSNVFVNRQVNVTNITNITNIYGNSRFAANNVFVRNSPFVPVNSTRFAGMTTSSRMAFMNGGRFQKGPVDPRGTAFRSGHSFARAPSSGPQVSGPLTMRPGRASFTPTRTFARSGGPPMAALQRGVVRGGVPVAIAQHGAPVARAFAPANRTARVIRQPMVASRQNSPVNAQSKSQFAMRRQSSSTLAAKAGPRATAMRSHAMGHGQQSIPANQIHGNGGSTHMARAGQGLAQQSGHPSARGNAGQAMRSRPQPRSFAGPASSIPRSHGMGSSATRPMPRSQAVPRMRSTPSQQWHFSERAPSMPKSGPGRPSFQPAGPQRGGGPSRGGGGGGGRSDKQHHGG
ncbi:MAG: DUF6600 domain-containing protein [Fimbriimonadales bacterium]